MKNVRKGQLKKCIIIECEEFTELIQEYFGNETKVEYTLEGIGVYNDTDNVDYNEICEALAKHFEVEQVTSFHMDDCDYTCVWIVYKDENDENIEIKEKIENIKNLQKSTPNGYVIDADTILCDIMKNPNLDFEITGIALELFELYEKTTDKKGFEKLFSFFTDKKFEEFVEECEEKTTRREN
jgi:hypothetical protein